MKLKNKLSIVASVALISTSLMASEAVTQEQLDEVWEVLDKVETKAFTDKLNWSADLRGRVDSCLLLLFLGSPILA